MLDLLMNECYIVGVILDWNGNKYVREKEFDLSLGNFLILAAYNNIRVFNQINHILTNDYETGETSYRTFIYSITINLIEGRIFAIMLH